jgi:arylsulfatase A
MYRQQFPRRSFLKAAGGALLGASMLRSQPAKPPNVVLILCDDLGFGDVHSYGSSIATPNIDGMAQEGVRFRQFYSASNVCSPSRAGILTGQYPTRVGVPDVLTPTSTTGLSLSAKTIAEVLKPVGYSTMCVGKWHLGTQPQYMPTSRGFDSYYGIPYSNDQSPSILVQNTTVIESPVVLNTLTERYTQQAANFIQSQKNSPFFLYMAHTFPHIPLAVSTAFQGKSGLGLYGDVVEEIDWSVGQVLQSLKDNGVDDNTLVMFTSDNGPWFLGSPGKLRGRKGWSYEGGVREPFIARFPGRIPASSSRGGTNPGRLTGSVATTMDLLPTIAALCGAPLPSTPLDGVNIWPVLSEQQPDVTHDIFLYFDSWNMQCARMGDWKLHVSRYNDFAWSPDPVGGRMNLPLSSPELYNLELDPDESYDVAADNPDIVAQIQAGIQRLLPTFPAQVMNTWNATMALQSFELDGALPALVTPCP